MDQYLITLFNSHLGRSEVFDQILYHLTNNVLFKGLPAMMLIWALWMRSALPAARDHVRARLAAVMVIGVLAIAVGRILALTLPFRQRPLLTEGLGLKVAPELDPELMRGWSAFPSDHAVLFFALATGLLMIDRRLGILAYLHAALIVTLPRVYFGLHWPSDIVADWAVGAAMALLLMPPLARGFERLSLPGLIDRHAVLAYPMLFLVTFQIATLFNSARWFLKTGASLAGL